MDASQMLGGGMFALTMIICVAFLHGEGVWGNALLLISMLLAVLVAVNAFEPFANLLQGFLGGEDYMDVLAIWLLFIITFTVLRLSADAISRLKVRFNKNVEQVGTFIFSGLVGLLMYAFIAFTLHTAPLQPDVPTFGFGSEKKNLLEANLYSFLKYESEGAMASFLSDHELDSSVAASANMFGRYKARREAIAKRQ